MSCRSRRAAACAAVAALLLAGCHASPRPNASPRLPPIPQLQHDLAALTDTPALERSFWGVLVRSAKTGETLYASNERKLFMPASNMKIVTLAVAASRLGWDYTYETRALTTAPIDGGVLRGDLVVVGSGDPSIGARDGGHPFDDWVAALKARGITRIDGRIVADDRAFEEPLGAGWPWDDLGEGYSAAIGALQFNENSVQATIAPGLRAGDEAIVATTPPGSTLSIRNRLVTGAPGTAASIRFSQAPGGAIEASGSVPIGQPPIVHSLAVPDPTIFFANVLRTALIAGGIDVRGPAVKAAAADPPLADSGTVLVSHRSAPLSALAVRLMKISQNLYAETLLRTIAAAANVRPATPEAGRRIVQATLESWGAPAGGLIMADGSGLSRDNYVAPETIVAVLSHLAADPALGTPFVAALPIAGRDGTLGQRMQGTIAEGNAHAKTGSIGHVRALSGYVTDADGEPLIFSIIANNYGVPSSEILKTTDAMVVRLAGFSRR